MKAYCIAFGCLNNNIKNKNLTFFTLPKDIERRQKWLTLIDREDLLQKEDLKKSSYLVCSAHFEDSSIKVIKQLKETALPTKILQDQSQEGSSSLETQSTSTRMKEDSYSSEGMKGKGKGKDMLSNTKQYVTVETQTEPLQSTEKQDCFSKYTQTSNSLIEETPRKRKLSNETRQKRDTKICKS